MPDGRLVHEHVHASPPPKRADRYARRANVPFGAADARRRRRLFLWLGRRRIAA
jgi:hypothetical protein